MQSGCNFGAIWVQRGCKEGCQRGIASSSCKLRGASVRLRGASARLLVALAASRGCSSLLAASRGCAAPLWAALLAASVPRGCQHSASPPAKGEAASGAQSKEACMRTRAQLGPDAFIEGQGWPGVYSKDSTAAWRSVPPEGAEQPGLAQAARTRCIACLPATSHCSPLSGIALTALFLAISG